MWTCTPEVPFQDGPAPEPPQIVSPTPNPGTSGNPITSQRITDVVLGAFNACAASQGCCNIISFGMGGVDANTGIEVPGFGVGETICGGYPGRRL
jgi:N-methylhydantoinase B/oxoprolinase/acetone carboxylase alpha subunit